MTPFILAVLLAAADPSATAPASAQAPASSPSQAKPDKTKDPNKPVCRLEDQIGSNIRVKKCMTQAQWEQQDEIVRQYFQDAGDNGGVHTAHVSSGAPGG